MREPNQPVPLSEALDEVVRGLGGPSSSPRSLRTVFGDWDMVVGDAIAAHARPVSLVDGRLVVLVDQPGWATQLRFLQAELMTRLNDAMGAPVVQELEVRVGRPQRTERPSNC